VLVFRDITEQQKQEEEFLRAQKLESVGLLAGGIAHDFNNILTAIFGNIQLARLGLKPDTPAIEPLAEAEKAFSRARDLTQQLLTFAKGGAPIRKTAAIAELLIETTRFAMRGTNHLLVEFDIAPDLQPVKFDAGQISQAINNIVINAKQAMPAGGRFRVEAQNAILEKSNLLALAGGRYVQLRFKDWGGGIAPEHMERVFDPYFTTKQAGSGLGLATAYSIVRRHDGHITANSKVGKGSTFTVYLPVSDEVAEPPPAIEAVSAGHGRILLMDDDPAIRRVGSALLGKLGYEAETAKDGVEALRLYGQAIKQGRPFAVVILDLTVVGGMGGVDCLLHLKRLDPPVRALVSSGYSNNPVMAAYADHGFHGVVAKPYQLAELSKTLAALLALGARANPLYTGGANRALEDESPGDGDS
jgi:CheY-like chemotaxis protein